jgi:hypothetical protein
MYACVIFGTLPTGRLAMQASIEDNLHALLWMHVVLSLVSPVHAILLEPASN